MSADAVLWIADGPLLLLGCVTVYATVLCSVAETTRVRTHSTVRPQAMR
jgi:hypothetical protein